METSAGDATDERSGAGLGPVAVGIVTAILPAFLLGSLSVQVRADLGYGEATAGLVLAAFFAASAVVSSALGRWVDSVGPRRALVLALSGGAAVQLAIATTVRSAAVLAVLVAAAGVCNATAQLGANVFIATNLPPHRQGIGFAVKQSAMPGASLVAGLALPALALPFGWRWAFAAGALLTGCALVVVQTQLPVIAPTVRRHEHRESAPRPRGLVPMAVAAAFATAAAITLGGFFVESAIDADVSAGVAGLLFSAGSVVSIVVRLGVGVFADRRRGDLLGVVAAMLVLGAATSMLFTWRSPLVHLLGVPLAFGAGWAWPGLFNLSVVRAAPSAPGRATGITQTGTYLGGACGPIVFGTIAQEASFAAAWWLAAGLGLAAAAAVLVGRASLRSSDPQRSSTRP